MHVLTVMHAGPACLAQQAAYARLAQLNRELLSCAESKLPAHRCTLFLQYYGMIPCCELSDCGFSDYIDNSVSMS